MALPRGKPFKKGEGGRKAGSQNTLTKTVRETVLSVFNELQEDPQANLMKWAKKETTEFYRISSKLIPNEMVGTINNKISLTIVRGKLTS